MSATDPPVLAGIHHLKLPVTDLARSLEWYRSRLGYQGWILPEVLDPDGHTLRFYTIEHHTDVAPGEVRTIRDPRETAERLEREEAGHA